MARPPPAEPHDVLLQGADTYVRVIEEGGPAWYTLVESCGAGSHGAWLQEAWWREGLQTALVVSRLDPTVFFAAPVLIWVLTSIRRGDLEAWGERS